MPLLRLHHHRALPGGVELLCPGECPGGGLEPLHPAEGLGGMELLQLQEGHGGGSEPL